MAAKDAKRKGGDRPRRGWVKTVWILGTLVALYHLGYAFCRWQHILVWCGYRILPHAVSDSGGPQFWMIAPGYHHGESGWDKLRNAVGPSCLYVFYPLAWVETHARQP